MKIPFVPCLSFLKKSNFSLLPLIFMAFYQHKRNLSCYLVLSSPEVPDDVLLYRT